MIRAKTPGGHPLVVIVFNTAITDDHITHIVECEGCGTMYIIKCEHPVAVDIAAGVHPTRMRDYLTERAMLVQEPPLDEHLYDHVWGMIDFFDGAPCIDGAPIRNASDAPCDDTPSPLNDNTTR